MDGARKTAILLLSLDQAVAAEILAKLPREQVERITLAIANAENVTRDEQDAILTEFKTAFTSRPLIHPVGLETARELLERSLDQTEVGPMQTRIEDQLQAGPFAFLHQRHSDDVRRLIMDEHPQTIAVVTAQLPPNLAARVLAGFGPEMQADILARLARLGPTDANVLDEIAALLKERESAVPVRTGGSSRASDILRATEEPTSRSVLRTIGSRDAKLAQSLRDSLFSFKEITFLENSSLRCILENSDDCPWAMALKGASEPLRQHVLAALNPKVAQALKEEMDSFGPLRLSEILCAQAEIIDVILTLESERQIELPRQDTRSQKVGRSGRVTISKYARHELKTGNA